MAELKIDASNPLELTVLADPKIHFRQDEPAIGLALETEHAHTKMSLPIRLVLSRDCATALLRLLQEAQNRGILPRYEGKVRTRWRQ